MKTVHWNVTSRYRPARRKEEEMYRRTVHRWIAALALVATLGMMGARPAAAADLHVKNRLASLWSAVAQQPAALWDALIGWLGGPDKPPSPWEKADAGFGSDPNGTPTVASSTAPVPADGTN